MVLFDIKSSSNTISCSCLHIRGLIVIKAGLEFSFSLYSLRLRKIPFSWESVSNCKDSQICLLQTQVFSFDFQCSTWGNILISLTVTYVLACCWCPQQNRICLRKILRLLSINNIIPKFKEKICSSYVCSFHLYFLIISHKFMLVIGQC